MEVLSLARSIRELDRIEADRRIVVDAYVGAIRSSAETLVEFETSVREKTSVSLSRLADNVDQQPQPETIRGSRTELFTLLDEYRRSGEEYVRALRNNLSATSKTLQQMLTQVSGVGTSHHARIEESLDSLRGLQQIDDLVRLKAGLNETTSNLSRQVDDMKRDHQMVVAQLKDEILTLHRQMAAKPEKDSPFQSSPPPPHSSSPAEPAARETAVTPAPPPVPEEPPVPQGMRRKELEDVIRERAEQGETFCLSVAWLSNLAMLFTRFAPDVVLEVMNRVAGRLDGSLAGNPFWAKWDDDCYVALMPVPKADATRTTQALAANLSGGYQVTHQGSAHEPNLKVTVGVIERNKNESGEKFVARLGMLLKTLRSTH